MPVDDGDRPLQLRLRNDGQNPIEEVEHLPIGVRAATKQDDARSLGPFQREQPRIIEIGRHDDASLLPSRVEDLMIGCGGEADRPGVDSFMPGPPEVPNRVGGHRHVYQESHPLNSMTSSSARLAA